MVERGTGVFVQQPPAPLAGQRRAHAAGEVTLNVVDADLREVVRMVFEDTLHVNYVIDPAVSGTITVQTSHPVASADLPAMLDAILRVNGAALVRRGDLYEVVPIDQALTSGLTPGIHPAPDANRPGFGVVVVPLRFVSAATLAPLLQPFAPPGGSLQVDAERNLLLLAGSRAEISTLTGLVAMFDVDWLAGMSFGLYPLEFAKPAELVAELEQIFELDTGPANGVLRFLPIERLNSVLVISSQPSYLDRPRPYGSSASTRRARPASPRSSSIRCRTAGPPIWPRSWARSSMSRAPRSDPRICWRPDFSRPRSARACSAASRGRRRPPAGRDAERDHDAIAARGQPGAAGRPAEAHAGLGPRRRPRAGRPGRPASAGDLGRRAGGARRRARRRAPRSGSSATRPPTRW